MTLNKVHFAYDDSKVYQGIDLEIEKGQRIVLVGPNGAGKSTLLKILGGILPIQQGERKEGLNAEIGYYSQSRIDMLNANRTVLQEALEHPETVARSDHADDPRLVSFSRRRFLQESQRPLAVEKNRGSASSSC